jgi:hypothetical protein
MLEASHCTGLTEKSLEKGGVASKVWMDDFECHHTIELQIQGFVHNAHSSLGNFLLDFVFVRVDEC